MKKHVEEILYRLEGDYALAKEECDDQRMDELRAGLKVARRYFAQGLSVCMEFIRARKN